MDSGSSPRLPAAASLSTNKLPSDSFVELAKARNRGSDYFDDTSSVLSGSVASMASTGKAVVCAECKQPEDQPSKPFVRCPKCRKIWHQCCLERLHPDCPKTPDPDWACGSCRSQIEASKASDRKRRHRSSTSNTKGTTEKHSSERMPGAESLPARIPEQNPSHNVATAEESFSSRSASQNESSTPKSDFHWCAAPDCNAPLYGLSSVKTLCKRHETEERHARAKEKASSSVPGPVLERKPIKKGKLYPVGPNDKPHLKRKRTENNKSNSTSNTGDMRPKNVSTFKPADGVLQSAVSPSSRISNSPAYFALLQKAQATRPISIEQDQALEEPRFLASETMVNVPTGNRNSSNASTIQLPQVYNLSAEEHSLKITPNFPSAHRPPLWPENDSPEYEPPPPQVPPGSKNTWNPSDEEHGYQDEIVIEDFVYGDKICSPASRRRGPKPVLTPTQKQNTDAPGSALLLASKNSESAISTSEGIHLSHDAIVVRLTTEHTSRSETSRTQPEMPSTVTLVSPEPPVLHDPSTDTNMTDGLHGDTQLDAELLPVMNGTSLGAHRNAELEAMIDKTGPDADPEAALEFLNEGWILGDRPPTCLELKLARGDYDENALDFYLEQQRGRDDSEYPTRAVIEAQNWGYIDPKTVWPEEPFTDDQAAAKREEIESRGGRKAAMGKIFTAQNLREKADNGWEIHQWNDKKNDDATKEVVKRLEDLFCVENLASLVPTTRNGRLVMIEREVPRTPEEEPRGPGRRKKKNGPRIYPVHGAPNTV